MKIRDRDYVSAAIVTGSKTPYMLFSIYASKCTSYTDHYCCHRYRFHDAGTGSNVLPGIWREAAGTGMGYMLNEGRACMQSAPWLMIFPGLAIFVVVVVFNMLGDSIP